MIYITGDTHGNPVARFNEYNFPEQLTMTKNDYVIICGDFGVIWNQDKENGKEYLQLEALELKPFTTLFVDGNHENFDRLNNYPVEEWNGGFVHKIRPSVIHLMRGQVYNIDNKKIFTFGGAQSHDIDDGILEVDDPRIKEWCNKQKFFRINKLSWWKEELPSEEEMKIGFQNLEKCNWKVDYVITHDMPTSAVRLYDALYCPYRSCKTNWFNDYLDVIKDKLDYKFWFCGHFHEELKLADNLGILYKQFVNIV